MLSTTTAYNAFSHFLIGIPERDSLVPSKQIFDHEKEKRFMPQGKIKRLVADRGFGFIETDGNDDLFFHLSALDEGVSFEELAEGDILEYEVGETPKGKRAENVRKAE